MNLNLDSPDDRLNSPLFSLPSIEEIRMAESMEETQNHFVFDENPPNPKSPKNKDDQYDPVPNSKKELKQSKPKNSMTKISPKIKIIPPILELNPMTTNAVLSTPALIQMEESKHYPISDPITTSFIHSSTKWLRSMNQPSSSKKYIPGQMATSDTINSSFLHVHPKQKGNPILNHLRNIRWQYVDHCQSDYEFSPTSGALFLSIKFYLINTAYISRRISQLPKKYTQRILIVVVDVEDHQRATIPLNKLAISTNMTLIFSFSNKEAARYIETYKAHHNNSGNSTRMIKEQVKNDYLSQVRNCLTAIKSISSTNVMSLLKTFGTVGAIMRASMEQLALVPGLGEKKIKRIYNACNSPILRSQQVIFHQHKTKRNPMALEDMQRMWRGVKRKQEKNENAEKSENFETKTQVDVKEKEDNDLN